MTDKLNQSMNETQNNEEGAKYTVNIIDSPCGSGKTTYAMTKLLTQKGKKYFYITPFIKEVERVADKLGFFQPHDFEKGGKTRGCLELLKQGLNISTTHALFTISGNEFLNEIKKHGYTLVLDEMLDVSEDIKINHNDIVDLEVLERIVLPVEDFGIVNKGINEYHGGYTQVKKLMNAINKAEVYSFKCKNENICLIRQFSPDILKAFKEVWVMTYLFKDQIMYAYLLAHKFDVKFHYVKETTGNEKFEDKNFELIEGEPPRSGTKYKGLIKIHEDVKGSKPLNAIGEKDKEAKDKLIPLSSGWWKKHSTDKEKMQIIINNMHNYKQNYLKGKSNLTMWTVFNTYQKIIERDGYKKGFLEHTSKATNKYKDKTCLMYMIDKRPNPKEKLFYKIMGVTIDEARYSLGYLVQWVFRSAIRDNKPISIYIPSKRMRDILVNWLDGEM